MTDQRPYSRKIRCEVAATVVTKLEDDEWAKEVLTEEPK